MDRTASSHSRDSCSDASDGVGGIDRFHTGFHAARLKPQKMELDKYEYTEPKKDRKDLKIKMIYHGLVTKKKYTADITVKIDSGDKDKWEVLRIDYEDNNPSFTKPNRGKIDDLVKKFNR